MTTPLGTTCTACGTDRKKKGIVYHPETFLPYCMNPYNCLDANPNSVHSIAQRAIDTGNADTAKIDMLAFDEATEKFTEWLQQQRPLQNSERIMRMTTRPVTFRIGNYETAEFLLQFQEELEAKSVSDVVRYCIEEVMKEHGHISRPPMPVEVVDETDDVPEEKVPEKTEQWSF